MQAAILAKKLANKRAKADLNASDKTKQMLGQIMDKFTTFDKEMKIGTRQRREKEEGRINELQTEMGKVEQQLKTEKKRRVEMNKSIKSWMNENVDEMTVHFKKILAEAKVHTDNRIAACRERLEDLEGNFAQMQVDIPADIQRRTDKINEEFHQFQLDFAEEKRRRAAKEAEILGILADSEHNTATTFDELRDTRQNCTLDLRSKFDAYQKKSMKQEEKFMALFAQEMADLKNAINLESLTREREDDEMVEALNRYAAQLQKSLLIINDRDVGTYAAAAK
jgi:hypothetical protein